MRDCARACACVGACERAFMKRSRTRTNAVAVRTCTYTHNYTQIGAKINS